MEVTIVLDERDYKSLRERAGRIEVKNTPWHDADEVPTCPDEEKILYDYGQGRVIVLPSGSFVNWCDVKRWAYYER